MRLSSHAIRNGVREPRYLQAQERRSVSFPLHHFLQAARYSCPIALLRHFLTLKLAYTSSQDSKMSSEMAAAMPPPGSSSDFSQHSELWPSLIAVSVISLVIMTLAVSLRLYARIFKSASKALRVDDCKPGANVAPPKSNQTDLTQT